MPNITFESMFTSLQPQLQSYCSSSYYYPYDIFSIVPQENGNYTIETVSIDSTNIRLYTPSFNPLAIALHLEAMDETDAYYSRQQLEVNLLPSNQYYLIVSKFDYYLDDEEQNYRLTFRGPSQFTMTKLTGKFSYVNHVFEKSSPKFKIRSCQQLRRHRQLPRLAQDFHETILVTLFIISKCFTLPCDSLGFIPCWFTAVSILPVICTNIVFLHDCFIETKSLSTTILTLKRNSE